MTELVNNLKILANMSKKRFQACTVLHVKATSKPQSVNCHMGSQCHLTPNIGEQAPP